MGADVDVTVSNSMSVGQWKSGEGEDVVEVCRRAIRGPRVDEESGESGRRKRRGVWTATSSKTEISASLAWHGLPQLANRNFLLRIE